MQIRVMILLIFTLLVAVFAVLNTQPVIINYFFGEAEIELIFLIIFSILTGALFMFFLASMKQIQLSRRIKTLERENSKYKIELEGIKEQNKIKEPEPGEERILETEKESEM